MIEHADACGCCEGLLDRTPASLNNLPGLDELRYRVGTHATFKETMRAGLARSRQMRSLANAGDDDPTIALVDAWSTVLDVLTFYQERIANEGYLRTASERLSVAELARAIGYRLGPGTAAVTQLAIDLETAPGSPPAVLVEPGLRVQTLPGPGEVPQVFETIEAVDARAAWNAVRAARTRPEVPALDATSLNLAGVATNVRRGDALLFVGRERLEDATSDAWDLRIVSAVAVDQDAGTTEVTWTDPLGARLGSKVVLPARQDLRVYALRERASLFGQNAPDWRAMPLTVQHGYLAPRGLSTAADWPTLSLELVGTAPKEPNAADQVHLDAVHPEVVEGSWLVLSRPEHRELFRVTSATESSRTDFTLSAKTTLVTLAGEKLRERFDDGIRQTTVFARSDELTLAEPPILDPVQGDRIPLAGPVPAVPAGRALVVTGKRAHVAVAPGVSILVLERSGNAGPVRLEADEVLTVLRPYSVAGTNRVWSLERRDGTRGTVVATPRQLPAVAVDDAVLDEIELATAGVPPEATEQTTLVLAGALTGCYDRATFRVNVNVATATHGETKDEVLGSGDASLPFQRFPVKTVPVTYLPSKSNAGAASTLAVRANGILWKEVPFLLGLRPDDRAYVVHVDDDGRTVVQFGDGVTGARLPSGAENVTARYRVGSGLAGMADAGALSLLLTRPLGMKSVTNPFPATGASEPETADRARQNAPNTVKTLDRVVSLSDFEDFARAFAGVGKAQARWMWDGRRRLVHLTLAADDGSPLSEDAVTFDLLAGAIRAAGDPRQLLVLGPYEPLTFDLSAGVYVDPFYETDTVLDAVRAVVTDRFSFERRSFAEPAFQSEVVAAVQRVEGVVAMSLVALHRHGDAPTVEAVLPALAARPGPGGILAAQLLTVRPEGITLEARS